MDYKQLTVTVGEAEQPPPPSGDWSEVVRSAASGEWGTVTANRVGTGEKLNLRFSEEFGFLEHWASDDGPVSGARFPNRRPVAHKPVELPCCGCGIPLEVPDEYILPKADAVRLFIQFLGSGVLPGELVEPPQVAIQPVLPGMEEFVVPQAVLNVVNWQLL
jgi:hypothetical protein